MAPMGTALQIRIFHIRIFRIHKTFGHNTPRNILHKILRSKICSSQCHMSIYCSLIFLSLEAVHKYK